LSNFSIKFKSFLRTGIKALQEITLSKIIPKIHQKIMVFFGIILGRKKNSVGFVPYKKSLKAKSTFSVKSQFFFFQLLELFFHC
jgi:hypothetical protein